MIPPLAFKPDPAGLLAAAGKYKPPRPKYPQFAPLDDQWWCGLVAEKPACVKPDLMRFDAVPRTLVPRFAPAVAKQETPEPQKLELSEKVKALIGHQDEEDEVRLRSS